ncbi:MAG TPA: hypothetical protein ENN51_06180 [candidate division WOR-3 bacterium]|uniref:Uncharacterized protein n=1 Tax=candidate division WOR-3 bacterium TaxID=2052148 RepID=A0A7V0T6K1_UNCW3|nr:hypothetical protein [candidate division WOR-3 bacterium]
MKRLLVLTAVVAAVLSFTSCEKATKLIGTLILQTGQTGDVQNTKVQLFLSSDLTGSPVKEVGSKSGGNASRSEFEFTDVLPGYYYLLAWKDLNGDGKISDGDIVGIHGGTYRPGHGGTQVTVSEGKTVDVGEVVMLIYKELLVTASGARAQGGAVTNFSYSFNHDVSLSRFSVVFPDEPGVEYEDTRQPGAKTGGTTYNSEGWNIGGAPMPTGAHILRFQGTWDGNAFDISVEVSVN